MMFDPPDFPYKDLSDTLRENYDPDDLLFTNVHNDTDRSDNLSLTNNELVAVTEQMILNVENELSYHSNETGRYFNLENSSFPNTYRAERTNEQNSQLFSVSADNLFNYEPTLLDDSTVNQFLLPLQSSSDNNKDAEFIGPDLLALHSCVVCHEIFTSDADLLDHTILLHASINLDQDPNDQAPLTNNVANEIPPAEGNNNNLDFESTWLVCCLCERVLSTALEVQPSEQPCCTDTNGRGSVGARSLHTMFVCDCCNGLFADGDALDRHKLSCFTSETSDYYLYSLEESKENGGSRCPEVCFSCEICGLQYSTADQLKTHMVSCHRRSTRIGKRAHTNNTNSNKMWNCGSCNQLFATARELYKHKRGEDRPPGTPLTAYVCEECDKVLGSMCALHTHKKMHKITKPGYPCRICGRRFNQSGHLAIHMRMHTGERPYPCDLCPKAFKVKVERDDHRRTHTGERPFACAACPKTFTAAARLREHSRIHTDQRPYRCDICGAAFRRPYARTVHTLIHTGEKPHECDVCGTAFRRSGDMWKHKRTLHGIQSTIDEEMKKE